MGVIVGVTSMLVMASRGMVRAGSTPTDMRMHQGWRYCSDQANYDGQDALENKM